MHWDINHEGTLPGHQQMFKAIDFHLVVQLQLTFAEPYKDEPVTSVFVVPSPGEFLLVYGRSLSGGCSYNWPRTASMESPLPALLNACFTVLTMFSANPSEDG